MTLNAVSRLVLAEGLAITVLPFSVAGHCRFLLMMSPHDGETIDVASTIVSGPLARG